MKSIQSMWAYPSLIGSLLANACCWEKYWENLRAKGSEKACCSHTKSVLLRQTLPCCWVSHSLGFYPLRDFTFQLRKVIKEVIKEELNQPTNPTKPKTNQTKPNPTPANQKKKTKNKPKKHPTKTNQEKQTPNKNPHPEWNLILYGITCYEQRKKPLCVLLRARTKPWATG